MDHAGSLLDASAPPHLRSSSLHSRLLPRTSEAGQALATASPRSRNEQAIAELALCLDPVSSKSDFRCRDAVRALPAHGVHRVRRCPVTAPGHSYAHPGRCFGPMSEATGSQDPPVERVSDRQLSLTTPRSPIMHVALARGLSVLREALARRLEWKRGFPAVAVSASEGRSRRSAFPMSGYNLSGCDAWRSRKPRGVSRVR